MLAVAALAFFVFSVESVHAAPLSHARSRPNVGIAPRSNTTDCLDLVNPISAQLPLVARVAVPYTWALSPSTFSAPALNASFQLTASGLPSWIEFDASNGTFAGTPASGDEGSIEIQVTAVSDGCPTVDTFTLNVVDLPSHITVGTPLPSQFVASNPSLSSIFPSSSGSALSDSGTATVRVPPQWSFSLGFNASTILVDHEPVAETHSEEYSYVVRTYDGLTLPSWLTWHSSPSVLALNGASPDIPANSTQVFPLAISLVCDSFPGYSMLTVPFDVVVASHELSMTASALPALNITLGDVFSVSFDSTVEFESVLVDGAPIQPGNISALSVDTSQLSGWSWDEQTGMLAGTAPSSGQSVSVPVQIGTNFGQNISTTLPLALLPSFFKESSVPEIETAPGKTLSIDLTTYFANSSALGEGEAGLEMSINVTYEPLDVGSWFAFNIETFVLTGQIPKAGVDNNTTTSMASSTNTTLPSSFAINFLATSSLSHATSTLNVPVGLSGASRHGGISNPFTSSNPHTRNLARGLLFGFGGAFGVLVFILVLACCRRANAVKERRRQGVVEDAGTGRMGIGAEYKKAMDGLGFREIDLERGYGWTENMNEVKSLGSNDSDPRSASRDGSAADLMQMPAPLAMKSAVPASKKFPLSLGRGNPSQSPPHPSPYPNIPPPGLGGTSSPASARTITKGAFFRDLKARAVSGASGTGKYVMRLVTASTRGRGNGLRKVTGDMISKPVIFPSESVGSDASGAFGSSNSLAAAFLLPDHPAAFEPDLSVKATCPEPSPLFSNGSGSNTTRTNLDLKAVPSQSSDGSAQVRDALFAPSTTYSVPLSGSASKSSNSSGSGSRMSEEEMVDAIVRTASVHSAASRGSEGVGLAKPTLVRFGAGNPSVRLGKKGDRVVSHRAELVSTPPQAHASAMEEGASFVRAFGEDDAADETQDMVGSPESPRRLRQKTQANAASGSPSTSKSTSKPVSRTPPFKILIDERAAKRAGPDGPIAAVPAGQLFDVSFPLPPSSPAARSVLPRRNSPTQPRGDGAVRILQADGTDLPGFIQAEVKGRQVLCTGYSVARPGERTVKLGAFDEEGNCVRRFVLAVKKDGK